MSASEFPSMLDLTIEDIKDQRIKDQ